jgi:hypothetical protein
MNPFQTFIANLNKYIDEQKESSSKEDKNLLVNNIHVKNAILLLGEKVFNEHIESVISYAYEDTENNEKDFDYFYSYLGQSFHKAFRQYDVSERFDRQKYKAYELDPRTSGNNIEFFETKYNVDGRIDTINWTAYSLHSNFWDVLSDFATKQYNEKVAK